MEPSIRLYWSQTCSSQWYPGLDSSDDPVWSVTIILVTGVEVMYLIYQVSIEVLIFRWHKADSLQAR